jgi:pSer/pThr/pTyr-binding forkhead associated (FHA) protein
MTFNGAGQADTAMWLFLEMVDGKQLRFEVKETSFTLGRSQKCRIAVADEKLSREHCLFDIDAGHVFVTDLGSSNGVFLAGKRLEPHMRTFCAPGKSLTIGNSRVTLQEESKLEVDDSPILDRELALATMPNINAPQLSPQPFRVRNPVLRTPREMPEEKEKRISRLGFMLFVLVAMGIYYYKTIAKPQLSRTLKTQSDSRGR